MRFFIEGLSSIFLFVKFESFGDKVDHHRLEHPFEVLFFVAIGAY